LREFFVNTQEAQFLAGLLGVKAQLSEGHRFINASRRRVFCACSTTGCNCASDVGGKLLAEAIDVGKLRPGKPCLNQVRLFDFQRPDTYNQEFEAAEDLFS